MRNKISRYEENQVDRFLYDLYLLWGGNLDEDMCIGEGWIEIIKAIQLAGTLGKPESEREKIEIQVQGYEQIKELISVDTLKSMQLLGFNYKAAIGEPLTQLCANAITGWGNKNNYHKKR